MEYMNKGLVEIHEALKNGEVTSEELIKESLQKSHEVNEKCNAFVTILDDAKGINVTDDILSGIPYGIKDNYSTKGILSTGSSNTLKDYVPFFTATAIENLEKHGAVATNKTVMDEFGMGGTGTTGHTGIVKNPWDKARMCAGSSAGSAAAVAAGVYPYATGSDTGDSVRKPASFGGVVGFKPTYGRISRYGLFAFASSLDHVALFTRNVSDAAIVTDVLKGKDINDMTTLNDDKVKYEDTIDDEIKGKKLFYIKEICGKDTYKDTNDSLLDEVMNNFHLLLDKAKDAGFVVEEVSIDKELLGALYPTYMCISCAEATSNNSNLTGIQFGPRGEGDSPDSLMFDARTKGFSELIKRRFVLGSYILQKENQEKLFLNAQRVRRMIVDKINDLFKEYDGMIAPCSGGPAPRFDSSSEVLSDRYLILENHLVIGNFGGFPSITIPYTMVNDMPVGVNITGRVKDDALVLNMAKKIEDLTGLKDIYCEVGDEGV